MMKEKFEIWKTNRGYTIYIRNEEGHYYQLSHIVKIDIDDTYATEVEAREAIENLKYLD